MNDTNSNTTQDLFRIHYNEEQYFAEVFWIHSCGNILDQKHRQNIEKIRKSLASLEPAKILIDLAKCNYIITPEVNPWYENTLAELFVSVKPAMLAFVVPGNLFNDIVFEATEETLGHDPTIETQYFRSREKAEKWLKVFKGDQ
ncbi:MAG: hypothetical protein KQI35_19040 [Bacteroidetes bacterium]|nr:hypothetical protein [Bacteroidota bacterium]